MRTLAIMHLGEMGGPAQHVFPWLDELARRGSLEVVVPTAGPAAQLYRRIATTTVLPYSPLTFPTRPHELVGLAVRFPREVSTFRRHLRQTRPDVVVIVTSVLPAALLAARSVRIPAVVYVSEIYDKGVMSGPLRRAGGRAVATLTARFAASVVACSDKVSRQFYDLRWRRATIATIYPGLDPAFVAGDGPAFRRERGLEEARPLIAVVGNITRGRGQDVAIRALSVLRRRFPEAHCIFAGTVLPRRLDRRYRTELTELAERTGVTDAVTFLGFVERIGDVYGAADVVVNPARFNEPFGRVAIEALLARRPVVATRVGAIPEVLRDGEDALLVEPDDPDAVADAVARLWEDESLAHALVARGRARVIAEFSQAPALRSFTRVVEAVLESAPGR